MEMSDGHGLPTEGDIRMTASSWRFVGFDDIAKQVAWDGLESRILGIEECDETGLGRNLVGIFAEASSAH